MPAFGCGVSVMTMNQTGASSMNTIAATKACAEFGEERASLTANLDRSRSVGNEYHFPDGCGNSGAAFGNWFLEQFEEYAKDYKEEHGRRPPVSTALGVTTVVTPDEEAVAQWDAELRNKFVKDAVEVLGLWYGRPLDGWAKHVDEGAIEERGLTREDELGDEGLHIHGAGRLEDTLLDEETLAKYLGEKGAKNYCKRYRGKNDGCMYRTGTILNKGKLHLLHQMFAVEMAERGWREKVDENDLEATGWSVKPHITGAEKREREKQGEVFPEAGRSANKYARQARWERKKKAEQAELESGQTKLAEDQAALADDREQLGLDQQALEDAQARLRADEDAHAMRVMRSHRALNRARAANAIDREGWEPPTTAKLFTPAQLSGNALALWRLVYEGDGSGLTGDWADLSQYENESGELDVERARALLDTAMTGALGGDAKGCAVTSAEGAWWVTDVPASARDALYESDRAQAVRRYARDELQPRLLVLNERDEDVNEPQRGVEAKSDLVAQCIQKLEVDNKALDDREQALKRDAAAHEVGYFPAVDAEGKDTIIALSVTDKGRDNLANPETRIETANRLLPNIRATHPLGTQTKDGRTITGEFVPGYLFREAAADEREQQAEQAVSEAKAVVDASRKHDAEVEDWWADAKRTLKKTAHQLAKDVGRFLGKAARKFQSSTHPFVRETGNLFAKAAREWYASVSDDDTWSFDPTLAQIFDDDDHDEWQRVEEAKPKSLDDELMGVFDEMHGRKSSTGKARANAQQVQAQRVSFAERWGIDIDDVDTTPSIADYDEPDF